MKPTRLQIETFLRRVSDLFPIPLAQKQDLSVLADKLYTYGTLCCVIQDQKICSMAAGYTDHTPDSMGYLSVVATLPEAQRKGYSGRNIEAFLKIARDKGLRAVHLYTDKTNKSAIQMYEKAGFIPYVCENEPRPSDVHLICRFEEVL